MSASEKLKALKPEGVVVSDAPFEGYHDVILVPLDVMAQIVAVVEEAEDAVVYGAEFVPGTNLGRALAALDEALSTE